MTLESSGGIIYYADVARLERLVRIADAIMRSQPVGVPPRLVREWREAQV